ncbi:MAG: hydrogenase maturation protease, partial [Candidatus Bipolaricaulaceae bacterium]
GNCCAGWKARAVVALGNPDRADDGVAHHVLFALSPREGVEFLTSVKTGLDLALSLLEYEKVLVIDAGSSVPPGEIALAPLAEEEPRSFRHGLGLAEALRILRRMGLAVPEVWVLAIGVSAEQPFQRGLSPAVERALPKAQEVVERWLRS